MEILVVFLVLGVIEFGYLWFQWDSISLVREVAGEAHKLGVAQSSKYSRFVKIVGKFFARFKKLIWIPIALILCVNFLVSFILGGILMLIF